MTEQETKYIRAIGRRKCSIAQVRLYRSGTGKVTINEKDLKDYIPRFDLQQSVLAPFEATGLAGMHDVTVKVLGGGITGQAEAIRMGISRALIEYNPGLRETLKKLGYLSRDARVKERKKYGLKGARRAAQWSKR
jgi:small subunit ribosomal protein S9